jgi:ribosomal protein S18 acetylase RimI-like enzyme
MTNSCLNKHSVQRLDNECADIAQAIRHVSLAAYRIEAGLIGVQHFPPLLESVNEIIKNSNLFYGIYVAEELVGVIELEPDQGTAMQINRLVVKPCFFRQGIATSLLAFAKSLKHTMIVVTATANTPAIALYQRMGFIVEHTFTLDRDVDVCMLECPMT